MMMMAPSASSDKSRTDAGPTRVGSEIGLAGSGAAAAMGIA